MPKNGQMVAQFADVFPDYYKLPERSKWLHYVDKADHVAFTPLHPNVR